MNTYDGIVFNTKYVESISSLGVLQQLNEIGCNVSELMYFGGIHCGALTAMLCACSFTIDEITNFMCAFKYDKTDETNWMFLPCFKMKQHNNEYVQIFVDNIINTRFNTKGSITFSELYKLTMKHLKIVTTNITKQRPFYMDHIHTPTMPVSLAISISMRDPCLANPIQYDGYYLIGGKVTAQHDVFKNMLSKRFLVIVTLNFKKLNVVNKKSDYAKGIIESMQKYSESVHVLEPNEHICSINFSKFKVIEALNQDKKRIYYETLINFGSFSFKTFLMNASLNKRGSFDLNDEQQIKQSVRMKRQSLDVIRNSIDTSKSSLDSPVNKN